MICASPNHQPGSRSNAQSVEMPEVPEIQRPLLLQQHTDLESVIENCEYKAVHSEPYERGRKRRKLTLDHPRHATPSSTSASLTDRLPLTESNLQQHQAMSQSAWDGRSTILTPAPSTPTASQANTATDSRTSKAANDVKVGEIMEGCRILAPETSRIAWEHEKDFQRAVRAIVQGDRNSEMRPESLEKFQNTRDRLRDRNEATLMNGIMNILTKESRSSTSLHDELFRDFDTDFLDKNFDTEFRRGFKPFPEHDQASMTNLATLLAKSTETKNPKPDITYGIQKAAFTPKQLKTTVNYEEMCEMSPGMLFPFLIFEWKGAKGMFPEAKIQARRGGAALVSAMSRLRAILGVDAVENAPDEKTMVFSCVLNQDLAHIYVHWQQLREGDGMATQWYMSKVAGYQIDEKADVARLRRDLHNILDWGLLNRLGDIKTLLDKLMEGQTAREELSTSNKRKKF